MLYHEDGDLIFIPDCIFTYKPVRTLFREYMIINHCIENLEFIDDISSLDEPHPCPFLSSVQDMHTERINNILRNYYFLMTSKKRLNVSGKEIEQMRDLLGRFEYDKIHDILRHKASDIKFSVMLEKVPNFYNQEKYRKKLMVYKYNSKVFQKQPVQKSNSFNNVIEDKKLDSDRSDTMEIIKKSLSSLDL